jgi:hypothetical protein
MGRHLEIRQTRLSTRSNNGEIGLWDPLFPHAARGLAVEVPPVNCGIAYRSASSVSRHLEISHARLSSHSNTSGIRLLPQAALRACSLNWRLYQCTKVLCHNGAEDRVDPGIRKIAGVIVLMPKGHVTSGGLELLVLRMLVDAGRRMLRGGDGLHRFVGRETGHRLDGRYCPFSIRRRPLLQILQDILLLLPRSCVEIGSIGVLRCRWW